MRRAALTTLLKAKNVASSVLWGNYILLPFIKQTAGWGGVGGPNDNDLPGFLIQWIIVPSLFLRAETSRSVTTLHIQHETHQKQNLIQFHIAWLACQKINVRINLHRLSAFTWLTQTVGLHDTPQTRSSVLQPLVSKNTAKAWYLVTNTFCTAGNYHSYLFKCKSLQQSTLLNDYPRRGSMFAYPPMFRRCINWRCVGTTICGSSILNNEPEVRLRPTCR